MRPISKRRALRTAQLTIATTMLTVPASAFALSGSTAAEGASPAGAVPVTVSADHLKYGDAVTIYGRTDSAQAGKSVAVQTATTRTATWRRVASTRVGGDGRFSLRTRLIHSGLLRAVPETVLAGPTSVRSGPATPVKVAARVSVASHAGHDVLGGQSIHVSGRVLPGTAGRLVSLQGHAASGWHTLARTRTGRRGGFAVRYRPAAAHARGLRVVFPGDRANARATDGAGTVTVFEPALASWYEDGGSTGCGFHATYGVANKALPCGTKVTFRHGGRTVTATVDDRGPYVGDREYDLNQNTAGALGFGGVGTVWASVG